MSWLSDHVNIADTIAPVFSLPAKAIESVTGMDWKQQLAIGAGVGAVGGLYGRSVAGAAPSAGMYPSQNPADYVRSSGNPVSNFSPWSLAAPVIGAGADIWSAQQLAKGQQEANLLSQESAREQMAFQERMSSTAHQREVADLRNAGINPVLSANSGASTPTGSSYKAENPAPDYRGIVPKGISSGVQLMQMGKDFAEADSRIGLNFAAAGREDANARVALNSAKKVAAEADVARAGADYVKKHPKIFSAGQWIKNLSPFATSAAAVAGAF